MTTDETTTRTTDDGPAASADARPPRLVRLLWDAWDELERVAAAVPTPGRGRSLGRLNAAGWIVAHVAAQQDAYWCVAAQGLEPDEWLADIEVGFGSEPSVPDHAEALAAFARVRARAIPYLRSLRPDDLDAAIPSGGGSGREQTVGDALARSVAHVFVHTGELTAIASLVGAPDLGAPGRLTHSTAPPAPSPLEGEGGG